MVRFLYNILIPLLIPGALIRLWFRGRAEPAYRHHLAERFGGELNSVKELIAQDSTLGEPLINGLPYLRAEAIFAIRKIYFPHFFVN